MLNPGTVFIVLAATSLRTSETQACGRAPLENRIVGGSDARQGAWPWQVDIQLASSGQHVCGGSLITRSWLLSAAHCFPNPSDVSLYSVYIGRHYLSGYNQYESYRSVLRVLVPAAYVDPQSGRDVALVELSEPVVLSDYVQPVCLPNADVSFPSGTMCHVTGWGHTQEAVSLAGAGSLQEVEVPIIGQTSCQKMYQAQSFHSETADILSDMICAGYQEGGKDACQGDSGGPLVCPRGNGTWIQVGVVSFGFGCAQRNRPGVYAKVSAFANFIRSTVPEAHLVSGALPSRASWVLVLGYTLASLLLG